MPTLSTITDWLSSHGALLATLGTLSVLLLAVTVFATPWLLGRLPADYFRRPDEGLAARRHGSNRALLLVARNVAGLILVVLGLVMMVTPGPGVVALLLGLSLCHFPGKHTLIRRLVAGADVFASLNWIRRRTGATPFEHPYATNGGEGGPGEAVGDRDSTDTANPSGTASTADPDAGDVAMTERSGRR